jgi:hypothetical protein
MKKIAFIILIAFSAIRCYGQHPYIQTLKTLAVITFPDTPKMADSTGDIVYSKNVNYNYYFTQISDQSQSFSDVINASSDDSVYTNFIRSTLKNNSGKLIYRHHINTQGLSGTEYAYTAFRDSTKEYRYRQLFYFNNTMILNGVTSGDSLKRSDTVLTNYFNSFKLTIRKSEIVQSGSVNLGKGVGYAFAVLLAIAVIIALIAGIIATIRKRVANRNIP